MLVRRSPAEALGLASAVVFRNDGGTFRRCGHARGWGDGNARSLPRIATFVLEVRGADEPVRIGGIAWGEVRVPAGSGLPVLALPIGHRTETRAIVLYGAHKAGDDLNSDERKLLCRLRSGRDP